MQNLIPYFIYKQYRENNFEGEFSAIAMFMDISGFTPMTENLMKEGKEGAEVLSVILNNFFEPIVNIIYKKGGFISGFAGDAFTAIFPYKKNDYLFNYCFSALSIQEIFKKNKIQKTHFGNFEVSAKIGLSYGKVNWGIVGHNKSKVYFFKGDAINDCAYAEHQCNPEEIVLDKRFYNIFSEDNKKLLEVSEKDKYFILKSVKIEEKKDNSILYNDNLTIIPQIVSDFLPETIVYGNFMGEFRNVVSVFISFEEIKEDFINMVREKVDYFGGYFSGLDFGDKGANILILFGTPISYENDIERALDFILLVKSDTMQNIKAGVTFGKVYTGIIGGKERCTYSALGDNVNLSARFMMKANWQEIWVSSEIVKRIENKYDIKDMGNLSFKGKSDKVKVFELLKKRQTIQEIFLEGEMIGRETEMMELKKLCSVLLDINKKNRENKRKFGGIAYLYGEVGVGKSRLLRELIKDLKIEFQILKLQIDEILRKDMNPFIHFFKTYFKQADSNTNIKNKENFEEVWKSFLNKLKLVDNNMLEPIIKELIRTKSILGALLDLAWDDSIYEKLDMQYRFEGIIFSIKEFFKAQSLLKPTIILIEDIH